MRINAKQVVWIMAIAGVMSAAVFAADREVKVDDRLDASADALTDMMMASDHGIPQRSDRQGALRGRCPGMKKAGFIFGASTVADLRFVGGTMAWVGAHRLRCAWKAVVSGFRLELRRLMLCCS